MKKGRFCWLSLFGGLFFALCTVAGGICASAGEAPAAIVNALMSRVSLLMIGCLTVAFAVLLYRMLSRNRALGDIGPETRMGELFRRRSFLLTFFALLLAWLPYLVVFYPGNVSFDAARQLRMTLGLEKLTNQHPVVGTLLLGLFFRAGRIVNDNFGVFTLVAAQSLLNAAVMAACVKKILSLTGKPRMAVTALIFFALNPVWGMFQQTVVKDVPFTGLFLLYALCYLEAAEQLTDPAGSGRLTRKKALLLGASAVVCCLLRHGETLVVALSLLLLALAACRDKGKLLLVMLASVALAVGSGRAAVAATGAGPAPARATFSIFFQQTALYMKKYPRDVTPEQYAAVDGVLDAENIGELYNPRLTDPVKNTYKQGVGRRELTAYFKAWLQMFFRHPRTYADSFIHFSVSYMDPFHLLSPQVKKPFYINSLRGKGVDGTDFHQVSPVSVRKTAKEFTDVLLETPVLRQLILPGSYFWLCTGCLLLLWSRRRFRQMAVLSLPLLRMLMLLASPVAGYVRYALPLLAVTPLMMAWACASAAAADKSGNKDPSPRSTGDK